MSQWKYFDKAKMIWNGEWNDAHLEYNGKTVNYYDIEDALYDDFKEVARMENIEVNEENFMKHCLDNEDFIKDLFDSASEVT